MSSTDWPSDGKVGKLTKASLGNCRAPIRDH